MAASAGYAQISIHASHKGSDVIGSGLLSGNVQFQSTLPAREATMGVSAIRPGIPDFNPRFPQGKRRSSLAVLKRSAIFQSTLPAREATMLHQELNQILSYFNPRFPQGKRRTLQSYRRQATGISIHASRKGSDQESILRQIAWIVFQSTLPAREATRKAYSDRLHGLYFNPRFPQGKRQRRACPSPRQGQISIHASRKGSDPNLIALTVPRSHFNPRFP